MTVVLAVVAVVALVAAAVAFVQGAQARRRAAAAVAAAEERAAEARSAADATAAELARERAERAEIEDAARVVAAEAIEADKEHRRVLAQLAGATDRAVELQHLLDGRLAEIDGLQQRLAGADSAVAQAAADADSARRRAEEASRAAAAATESGHDPYTLWALELLRSERTWRHCDALGPDDPSPFAGHDPALLVAVRIDGSALREESGTTVGVTWGVQGRPGPAVSLAALRTVQELLAQAAKTCEHVDLTLTGSAERVHVAAVAYDAEGGRRPIELPVPSAFVALTDVTGDPAA